MMLVNALLFCLLSCVWGEDTSPYGGKLYILSPVELRTRLSDGIASRPAMFGIPFFNGEFTGVVHHSDIINNTQGCHPYPPNYFQSSSTAQTIALIDRGSCHFVTKVFNAENAGAAGAIIVDNVDEYRIPIMADDGTGERVHIPSILIEHAAGELIKKYVLAGMADVNVRIEWGLPRPDDRVEWELWFEPWPSDTSRRFISEFYPIVQALSTSAYFTPRYVFTFNQRSAGPQDCTNHLEYCYVHGNQSDGAHMLMETARQLCLWTIGNQTNDPLLWWEYVQLFHAHCLNGHGWNGMCGGTYLAQVAERSPNRGDLVQKISRCITLSGGFNSTSNFMLQEQVEAVFRDGIWIVPRVTINGEKYHGGMTCPEPDVATCGVFSGICAGFQEGTAPSVCTSPSGGCPPGQTRDQCGICGGDGTSCNSNSNPNRVMVVLLIPMVIIMVLIMIVGAVWIKRRLTQHEEEFAELRGLYAPLADENRSKEQQTIASPEPAVI